jgi:hypothetical protein
MLMNLQVAKKEEISDLLKNYELFRKNPTLCNLFYVALI